MLSPYQIATLLERYLVPTEAAKRSADIAADMANIGFNLEEDCSVSAAQWQRLGAIPQAEYVLPKTKFDLNGDDPHAAMEGSLLTRGNLLRLSHAVILGRKWIPGLWPATFQRALLGPEHLDAITEVYWLKFWHGLQRVERGPKESKDAPDADWLLRLQLVDVACTVNLEVKRRTSNLNTWFKHQNPIVPLRGIGRKFKPSGKDEVNVAAITVFQPPSADSIRLVEQRVKESPALDGVVIWIEHSHGGKPLLCFFRKEKEWAAAFVAQPGKEDLMIAGLTRGTLCLPEEVPAFLNRMIVAQRFGLKRP